MGFAQHGDAEFLGLGGLGAGVCANHHVIGLLAHRTGRLAAALDNRLFGILFFLSFKRRYVC